jgi:DNA-binding response OmpR family regulator
MGDAFGREISADTPDGKMLAGKTVLVVEDEYLVGLDMVQVLTDWGLDVTGPIQNLTDASTAAEARWDFVILDVNLDGGDTLDLARKLVQRGLSIVFVTAYADYDSRFAGDLAKVPRLGKPVPYRTLRRILTTP